MFQLQFFRVLHKVLLQSVTTSGCQFYNPTNEKKNTLYLKPSSLPKMKISATGKRHFNQLICTNLATPSRFSWNQLEPRNSNSSSIFWTDRVYNFWNNLQRCHQETSPISKRTRRRNQKDIVTYRPILFGSSRPRFLHVFLHLTKRFGRAWCPFNRATGAPRLHN